MGSIVIKNSATPPATPPADHSLVYPNASGVFKVIDENGVETDLSNGLSQEEVEDIIGAMLDDSSSIDLTYNDGTGKISAVVLPAGVVHQDLSGAGTNTHAQIDTHIASTSNPHSVTAAQVGADTTGSAAAAQAFAIQRANHTGTQTASTISDFATAFSAEFSAQDTDGLTEGATNLYFTDARVESAVDGLGGVNQLAGWDNGNFFGVMTGLNINPDTKGFQFYHQIQPNDAGGAYALHTSNMDLAPLVTSNNDFWIHTRHGVNVDSADSGLAIGVTSGQAVGMLHMDINHIFRSDIGSIEFIRNYFNLGNGTDAISVGGMSYCLGFGQVNDGVTMDGPMQGYGFQFNVADGATFSAGSGSQAFYDACSVACPVPGWTSYGANPSIAAIENNSNYTGGNINPTIPVFSGNAGFVGLGISGVLGDFDTGTFNGILVNPTVNSSPSAYGIWVSMDNVTPVAGAPSSLTFQDLYIEFTAFGDNNSFSMLYIDDVTAGSETANVSGTVIEVHMEDGVSTADQIKAAIEATPGLNASVTITVSGVGTNPQVLGASSNFSGGINPGNIKAGYFDGDVEITGDLTFGGALSIGNLNAFGSFTPIDGGGTPSSVHSLISQMTLPDNSTVNNVDTFGINTAMLVDIGSNCTLSSGGLGVGLTALGLPAVFKMGANSYLDALGGAIFALSIDAATDPTAVVDQSYGGRFLPIPGPGIFNRFYNVWAQQPAGLLATKNWGVYQKDAPWNYFEGAIKVGGSDEPGAGLILDVVGDSRFNGDIGFFNTNPVAQQTSSGAATASVLYTATEQTMIQEMYDALRAYGLLT